MPARSWRRLSRGWHRQGQQKKRRYLRQYKDVCKSCDQGFENEDTFSEEELQTIIKSLTCKMCEKNQAEVKGFCKGCYNKQYVEQKKVSKDKGDINGI